MEQKRINELKDRIKYAGFGEELGKELETQIKEGKEAFQLQHSASIGEKKMDYSLNFRKSEKNGQYYFNSFDAALTKPDGKTQSQTFYQNQNISAKEAFNLLEWRSVYKTLFNKDGERYNAWLQLDLAEKNDKGLHPMQQYHDKYGFELEKALGKLPIVEMEGMDPKDRLLYSLKKGNLHQVSIAGKEGKFLLAANPKYKTVSLYEPSGKRINLKDLREELEKNQDIGKKKGVENKKAQSPKKKTVRKKGIKV